MAGTLRNTFHTSCLISNQSPNIIDLILLPNSRHNTPLITICHTTQDYRNVATLHLKEPIPGMTMWKRNCKKLPSLVSHTPMSMGQQGLVVQQRAKRRNTTNPWSLRRHLLSTGPTQASFWVYMDILNIVTGKGLLCFLLFC
jgi:hypothetical protein